MTDEKRSNDWTRRWFMKAAGLGMIGAALADEKDALARPTRSARELLVYVGTYTSGASEGIYIYRLDLADGSLKHAWTIAGIRNPSYLT
ncbi:MAG TPA: beta-propeller fold lactonase family protein, partial [Pyrinomonadaceae bacterium]